MDISKSISRLQESELARETLKLLSKYIHTDNYKEISDFFEERDLQSHTSISFAGLERQEVEAVRKCLFVLQRERIDVVSAVHLASIIEDQNENGFTFPEDKVIPNKYEQKKLLKLVQSVIKNSEDELIIFSPFLTTNGIDELLPYFIEAEARGVNIKLVTRIKTGSPPKYNIEAVNHLKNEAPSLTVYDYGKPDEFSSHAKIVSSKKEAYVGTANLTYNGLKNNFELGVVIRSSLFENIRTILEHILESDNCSEISLAEL